MSDDHTTFHPESWHERPEVVEQLDQYAAERDRWLDAVQQITTAVSLPPGAVHDPFLLAFALVGAELARLLRLFVDASDPMEATDDALAALDAWSELEAAALRDVVVH